MWTFKIVVIQNDKWEVCHNHHFDPRWGWGLQVFFVQGVTVEGFFPPFGCFCWNPSWNMGKLNYQPTSTGDRPISEKIKRIFFRGKLRKTFHLGTWGEKTSSILKYPWSTKNEPLCDFHVFYSSFFFFGRVRTKRTAWTWNILIKRHIDPIFPNWPFSQVLLLECGQHRHLFSIHHRWPITVQKELDLPRHASYALKEENIALGYLRAASGSAKFEDGDGLAVWMMDFSWRMMLMIPAKSSPNTRKPVEDEG